MDITKNKIVKRIIKYLIFLLIGMFIFLFLQKVFIPKYPDDSLLSNFDRDYGEFYQLEEDSVDVIAFGGSTFLSGIDPLYIWGEYGVPMYTRATTGLSCVLMEELLYDALRYQKPKVVILSVLGLYFDYNDPDFLEKYGSNNMRRAIEGVPEGVSKLHMLNQVAEVYSKTDMSSWYFPLLRYHDRWKELTKVDIESTEKEFYLKGFSPIFDTYEGADWDFSEENKNRDDIVERNMVFYDRMIDVCKEEGIEVILLATPNTLWEERDHRYIKEYAIKKEVVFIDYGEMYEELGFSAKKCFNDIGRHLNYWGSQIVTRHLGEYLTKNYELTDKRNDENYSSWNEDYAKYSRIIEREKIAYHMKYVEDAAQVLKALEEQKDYFMIFMLSNGYMGGNIEKIQSIQKMMNTGKNIYENGAYIALFNDGVLLHEESSEDMSALMRYYEQIDGIDVDIISSGRMSNSVSSVQINGHGLMGKEGVQLIIYDKVLERYVYDKVVD